MHDTSARLVAVSPGGCSWTRSADVEAASGSPAGVGDPRSARRRGRPHLVGALLHGDAPCRRPEACRPVARLSRDAWILVKDVDAPAPDCYYCKGLRGEGRQRTGSGTPVRGGANAWRFGASQKTRADAVRGGNAPMFYQIDHLALAVLDRFWCPISHVQLTPEVSVVRAGRARSAGCPVGQSGCTRDSSGDWRASAEP